MVISSFSSPPGEVKSRIGGSKGGVTAMMYKQYCVQDYLHNYTNKAAPEVCRPDWQNAGPTAERTQTGSSVWTPGTVGGGRARCTGIA